VLDPVKHSPTEQYQKAIVSSLNNNKSVVQRTQKWKFINLNPQPPNLRALIKLHKQNNRIQLVINWRNVSAYNLAKHFVKLLTEIIQLPDSKICETQTDL
jgi:hypothetical protein